MRLPERLSPDAIRAFLNIAELWKLKDEQKCFLLGGTYKADPSRVNLSQDQLTRVSYIIGIFKALNILFGKDLADSWIQLPNKNPIFGGRSPLQYMIKGGLPAMTLLRQLLDSRRGGPASLV